ncbi:hypothetical protein N0B51_02335 [Tsuneonella sp. YG55]|uniref:Uncharacterized protein n=1 Tax=Tsuneonella litorea TaxID=2976475 RepID=A0A9X2VYV8_9SPHN|nr:hypothetical protein [Tsuneonella litorea]
MHLSAERSLLLKIALALGIFGGALLVARHPGLSAHYFRTQGSPVIALLCLALVALALRPVRYRFDPAPPTALHAGAIALVIGLATWLGTRWLMFDYQVARDTQMAVFDAQIFESGKLAQPLDPFWRPFARALIPDFLLDIPGNALLVSTYLPGNALLRTLFARIAEPQLTNPVLLVVAVVALWDIARRTFGPSAGAAWVALATLVLSAQVLVAAMTPYAMTAHLAFDVVWLWLFLRNRPWAHALAMAVGLYAMGLHQVVFHPLFAGPFILTLLAGRRWALFGAYALVYGAGVLFWFAYPSLIASMVDVVPQTGSAAGVAPFVEGRILPLFTDRAAGGLGYMAYNLLRLSAWMPLFMVPFVALAWPDVRQNRGIALPLFAGFALTLAAMFVLLPYQGHGWGYRYVHGLIGNLALLSGYGFARWQEKDAGEAAGFLVVTAALTALVSLPWLAWSAHAFVAPHERVYRALARQEAHFVIVDTDSNRALIDQVRNRADLTNRPILLSSKALSEDQVSTLCRLGSVRFADAPALARLGITVPADVQGDGRERRSPRFAALVEYARRTGCSRTLD